MNGLLFIDDEEGVRRSIKRALKRESYEIFTAANGHDGLALVETHRNGIGTVISDYRMPGMDGLETLQRIGSLNPEITRIILTGYATMQAAINATNTGIDGFLTKPFDNVELRAKIHEIAIRKHLKQFVPEQIYREIKMGSGVLAPRVQEATILFSDIRGFTRMSQGVDPQALVDFLNNHYFTPMGEIAYEFNGTVDKHMGDGMMVVFGSPVMHPDDAVRAIRAAVAMQRRAREINAFLRLQNGLRLHTGIGISTGKVFAGILGSLRKKEFSCIGAAVNIAARLQGLARGGEILMSASTHRRLDASIRSEALDPVRVKGIDSPINVFSVDPYEEPR
jgi:adenylate cyclase